MRGPRFLRLLGRRLRVLQFAVWLRPLIKDEPTLKGLRKLTYAGSHSGITEYTATTTDGPVLILRVRRDTPADVVDNLGVAYANTRIAMGKGNYTVPPLVSTHPQYGLLVLGTSRITRLNRILQESPEDAPAALWEAGKWLEAFHAGFSVNPGGFTAFERLDEASLNYRAWLERKGTGDPFEVLLQSAAEEAEFLDGKIVDFAKYHRSFAPRALHVGERQVLSTDLQNTKRRPRVFDIAHFLLEAAFEAGQGQSIRDDYGLPEGWSEAFLKGYGRYDKNFLRMLRFALIIRMIEVYGDGEAKSRKSLRYRSKRAILREMLPYVAEPKIKAF